MRSSSARGAHRLTPERQAKPAFSSFAHFAGLLGVAIVVGLLGTGGTYAFLNASASAMTSASTITAGTATLAVDGNVITKTNLYPGQSATATVLVSNTGDVPLALSVASFSGLTTLNQLAATVAPGACPVSGTPAAGIQVTSGAIGGAAVAAGASTSVCLTVSMPLTAAASAIGQSSTVTVTLSGAQQ